MLAGRSLYDVGNSDLARLKIFDDNVAIKIFSRRREMYNSNFCFVLICMPSIQLITFSGTSYVDCIRAPFYFQKVCTHFSNLAMILRHCVIVL